MNDSLHGIFAERMAQKLDNIKMQPQTVLQYGADGGASHKILSARYPHARLDIIDAREEILSAEPAAGVWQKFAKKRTLFSQPWHAPLPQNTYDLLWANLSFPFINADDATFAAWHGCLKKDGMLFFNTLGTMTLQELDILPQNTREMLALGDALLSAGFTDPVVDTENIYLTYRTAEAFRHDMQILGLANAVEHQMENIADKIRSGSLQRITLEIIYGHAVKTSTLPEGANEIKFYAKVRH